MVYYNERQPLLLECFKNFLRCIRQMGGASNSIYRSPYVSHLCHFPPRSMLKWYTKCQIWGTLSVQANGMVYCKERQPLLLECFKSFLKCIRQIRGASDRICQHLMFHIIPFSTEINLSQIVHEMPELGYPLSTANGMVYYKQRQPLLLEHFITFF